VVAGAAAVRALVRRQADRRVADALRRDGLTGLPDRPWALRRLESALSQGPAALVLLALDRFRVVDDALGPAAGDRLLVEVAARLRRAAGQHAEAVRLGGDVFGLVVPGLADGDAALDLARGALAALAEPVSLPGGVVRPAASAGVAVCPGRAGPAEVVVLLRQADAALLAAKRAGGARAVLARAELAEQAARASSLELALRRAVEQDRLDVVHQPVVDVTTGRVVGCEALARWTDDSGRPVPPSTFVPVAEHSDLVLALGDRVLARALRDAAQWPAGPHGAVPGVAVNVSVRQLLDPDLPRRVGAALADAGVDPGRLTLEVTESALAEDIGTAAAALAPLRDLGLRVALDDFGTGHASLSYLARLPVDVVKVDRSFVADVATDTGSAAIVSSVVAMAEAFGLRVIAEGVEHPDQLQALRRARVDEAQGFLLARPMPAAQVADTIAASVASAAVPRPRAPLTAPVSRVLDPARRFRLLLDAARDVTACVDLDSVLDRALDALGTVVRFTGGSVQLVEGEVLRLAATRPPATPEALAACVPLGQGIGGTIAVTGEPRYLPDITIVSAVPAGRRTRSTSTGVRSYYGVPLVAEGRIVGVLQVDSTEVDAFDEADRLLVLSFASVVGSAVQGVRHLERGLGALHGPSA
ncbi:MAG TPA: EAL domain-containing protein, partial [Mycobacteriales bacterium]|nr:EAL domain-containing protein [Mycobacteriales bacterium]